MKQGKKWLALLLAALLAFACCACQSAPAQNAAETVEETPAPQKETALYTTGTYQASAQGNNGPVQVEVEFSATEILSVKVLEHSETAGISDTPIERIPAAIVERQSLAIDTVSGATHTSEAILAAVADCVKQAGGDVAALENKQDAQAQASAETKELSTEILVIGAGFAGLSAANAAAETGAKVLVLEKQAAAGGTSALSGGETYGDGDVSHKEEAYDYWMSRAAEFEDQTYLDASKVRTFLDALYPTLDWLAENYGAVYSDDIKSNPVRRPFGGEGRGAGFVQLLVDGLVKNGAELMLETRATELIQDASGAVVGAKATAADGSEVVISARRVILTTGSFAQNQEMMEQYAADFAGQITTAAAGSTGDGMTMAIAVGAVPFETSAAVNNYAATAANGDSLNGLVKSSGLFVGQDGSRRSAENEDRYYISTKYLHVKEGMEFYAVYDADTVKQLELEEKFESNLAEEEVFKADTLEELAKQMNIDPAALASTVERYNELCAQGEDTDLGKKAELLLPVKNGPFYGVKNHIVIYSVLGGVKTNNDAQVLDAQGAPIAGLYAAGDMAARDLYGELYIGASAVASALTMGRVAGLHAANN